MKMKENKNKKTYAEMESDSWEEKKMEIRRWKTIAIQSVSAQALRRASCAPKFRHFPTAIVRLSNIARNRHVVGERSGFSVWTSLDRVRARDNKSPQNICECRRIFIVLWWCSWTFQHERRANTLHHCRMESEKEATADTASTLSLCESQFGLCKSKEKRKRAFKCKFIAHKAG